MATSINNAILEHLDMVDRFLHFHEFTDKSLVDWFKPMIDSN